jgi:hypothetical protein
VRHEWAITAHLGPVSSQEPRLGSQAGSFSTIDQGKSSEKSIASGVPQTWLTPSSAAYWLVT